ncbi:hypothetical protein PR048_002181 [Dryococelus australis]|uniref:Uncharacterized protein n=1 Tax=Dryococelus australis TaxID=614101 RepID=A0ABQ9IJH2_9NEOP|nr:hypothetical protein PR048_002181 [Dryococelus australis]
MVTAENSLRCTQHYEVSERQFKALRLVTLTHLADVAESSLLLPLFLVSNAYTHLSPRRIGFDPQESKKIGGGEIAPGFLHVGMMPDDADRRQVFSVISRFPCTSIPALLHTPHRLSRLRWTKGVHFAGENAAAAQTRHPTLPCFSANNNLECTYMECIRIWAFWEYVCKQLCSLSRIAMSSKCISASCIRLFLFIASRINNHENSHVITMILAHSQQQAHYDNLVATLTTITKLFNHKVNLLNWIVIRAKTKIRELRKLRTSSCLLRYGAPWVGRQGSRCGDTRRWTPVLRRACVLFLDMSVSRNTLIEQFLVVQESFEKIPIVGTASLVSQFKSAPATRVDCECTFVEEELGGAELSVHAVLWRSGLLCLGVVPGRTSQTCAATEEAAPHGAARETRHQGRRRAEAAARHTYQPAQDIHKQRVFPRLALTVSRILNEVYGEALPACLLIPFPLGYTVNCSTVSPFRPPVMKI